MHPSHLAGYATFIDMSERSFQLERGGQWVKGKSFPGFAPIGPWLVTADEIDDPRRLRCGWRSMENASSRAAPVRWCSVSRRW